MPSIHTAASPDLEIHATVLHRPLLPDGRPRLEPDVFDLIGSPPNYLIAPDRRLWSIMGFSMAAGPMAMWLLMQQVVSLSPFASQAYAFTYYVSLPFFVLLSLCLTTYWAFHVTRLHARGPILVATASELRLPRSELRIDVNAVSRVVILRGKILPTQGTTHEFGRRRIAQLALDAKNGPSHSPILVITVTQGDRRLRRAAKRLAEAIGKPYSEIRLAQETWPTNADVRAAFRWVL